MPILRVVALVGQSNCGGVVQGAVPDGIPNAAVLFWEVARNQVPDVDFDDFAALDVRDSDPDDQHGSELALGNAMDAAGHETAIVKIWRGNTQVTYWLPGDSHGYWEDTLEPELTDALTILAAGHPGYDFVFYPVAMNGENESASANPLNAQNYATNMNTLHAAIAGVVESVIPGTVVEPWIVNRVHIDTTNDAQLPTVRAHQETFNFTNVDDLSVGNVHLFAASQNTLGARQYALIQGDDRSGN